jgi:broad specificity phosphatase PhoE
MAKQIVEFCGAFTGKAKKQDSETMEQFAERIERALNEVMEKHAKRLNVNMGVDYGDLKGVSKWET